MQPSFDLLTVSHKKQKERRTKTTLKATELAFAYIAISLFISLVASVGFCWVEKRRETDANARLAGAYQRLLSLNHLTRNMRRQNALLLKNALKMALNNFRGFPRISEHLRSFPKFFRKFLKFPKMC